MKHGRWVRCFVLLLLLFCSGNRTLAAPAPEPSVRRHVWSVGLTGTRHSLKAGNDHNLVGNSAAFQIGRGYISDSWYILGTLDVLLGPYEGAMQKQINVDYFGTGATLWTGFSAQTLNLRSPEGGYGFALGISYADTIGRTVSRSHSEPDAVGPRGTVIDSYTLRMTHLALIPAIFFSWLEPARPRGNTPELLMTKSEGYFLTIGIAMPLMASYKAQYERRTKVNVPRNPDGTARDSETNHEERGDVGSAGDNEEAKYMQRVTTESAKGSMAGYSILVGLTAILGT